MPTPVIVAAARSPIGRAEKGSLRDLRPDDLGAQVVQDLLAMVPQLDPAEVDDLVVGCAQPAGEQGYNLGRVIAVLAGLDAVPAVTVNRYCASSLQATRMAMHAIAAGEGDVFIAAGVEMVSGYVRGRADGMPDTKNAMFAREVEGSDGITDWSDPREQGVLPDIYLPMGLTAENVAACRGISRSEQDAFALRSQQRAERAIEAGFWRREITPVVLPDGTSVTEDDCPRPGVTMEALAGLRPAFLPEGTVTAGNCCPLNDGAAALLVMSDVRAHELGVQPLARIVSTGVSALSPEIMGLGPVEACRQAMRRAGMGVGDVDLVEMNEAFAAQVIPSVDDLRIDVGRVNVHGGAIALGHPFGMTGARLITTLINGLEWTDKEVGMATMCVAGGQGMAMIIERAA